MLGRRLQLAVLLVLIVSGIFVAAARAAPVKYTMQLGSGSAKNALTLDGDHLTAFQVEIAPTSCTTGDLREDATSAWTVKLASPVALSDGRFQTSGTASSIYDQGAVRGYPADYTLSGSVSPDHSVVTGTVTYSNGNDPFLTGCAATKTFMAIPTVVEPDGPVNAKATFQSQFVSFNYHGGVISDLRATANFECGDSIDDAEVWMSDYHFPAIHASRSGRWALTSYVLDSYGRIIIFHITGRVSGKKATGRITVAEPPGLTFITGKSCHGNRPWTATRPTPPAPPGPSAFFDWQAVRVPSGAAYRYYFYAMSLSCTNGASAVQITVASGRVTIPCSAHGGWASGPLAPGRTYATIATAVKIRGGRVLARGTPVAGTISMPGAGDYWRPIGRLPGEPPA